MRNLLQLVSPSFHLKEEYLSFYTEWEKSGEKKIPWVIEQNPHPFEQMVQFLQDHAEGKNLPENWVADSTYWLIDETNRVLGVVNIRHSLSEFLLNSGGHIGYGIRPSERRKGYATKLLALSLQKAKELGIDQALVVCDEDNAGSFQTIIKNGGIADNDFVEEDGVVVKRFWIQT